MKKKSISLTDIVPVLSILVILLIFGIGSKGRMLKLDNITSVLSQSIPLMIMGLGMLIVISMGEVNFSIGSTVAIVSLYACQLLGNVGTVPMLIFAIVLGGLIGAFTGWIVGKFNAMSFLITLAESLAFRGWVRYALATGNVAATAQLRILDNMWVKGIILIVLILLVEYLMDYTRFGAYSKYLGENKLCANVSGVPVVKMKTIGFMLSGMLVGIGGLILAARMGGVTSSLGSSYEMRVLLALFLGGLPVEGGMRSKVYRVIIGAPCLMLLENGLTLCGIGGGTSQLIEGVVMIATCCLTNYLNTRSRIRDSYKMAELTQQAEETCKEG
jgi:ribose/xylose/arabinose/galactoside ABC-type transport system permease subunit